MRRIITAALSLTVLSSPAAARVERIEILSRQDFAAGIEFGDAGAYEKLRGRAFFALDPNAAANAPVDRPQAGAARCSRAWWNSAPNSWCCVPVDAARGNGTLLYEVNNRGNIAILRQLHEALVQQRSGDGRGRGQRVLVPAGRYSGLVGVGNRRRDTAG